MRAVILAAGRGSRIAPVTRGRPKCLLPFGDRTILDVQIESLFDLGVTDLAVVIGHESDRIVDHVARRHARALAQIEFITNAEFASTNNMYSLWRARRWLGGERFICLNADVLCHLDILRPAVAARNDISLVIDRRFREETTKVILRNGHVLALSKNISRQNSGGTFVGIATFSPRGSSLLFARAESLFAAGHVTQFFNDVVGQLAAERVPVHYTETGDLPWAEVDDASDLLFARTEVYPHLAPAAFPAGARPDRA